MGQDVTNNGTIDFSTRAAARGRGSSSPAIQTPPSPTTARLDLRNSVGSNGGLHLDKGTGRAQSSTSCKTAPPTSPPRAARLRLPHHRQRHIQAIGQRSLQQPRVQRTGLHRRPHSRLLAQQPQRHSPRPGRFAHQRRVNSDKRRHLQRGHRPQATPWAHRQGRNSSSRAAINIASRFLTSAAVTYTQSGGTLNVATLDNGLSSSASFG